jgi:hypothetical protein
MPTSGQPEVMPSLLTVQRAELKVAGIVRLLGHLADGWDMAVFHPDCTYLTSSGLHWNGRVPGRTAKTEASLAFVGHLLNAPIPMIALENPAGCIGTRIRPASQFIQPWQFGDDASKATGLWLVGLPLLKPTTRVSGRLVIWNGKRVERWANQTDSGQNKLGPSEARKADRARTYQGIAKAMADQWTKHFQETR